MTTPTTQREADERELAIAQEAAYPYPGECAHTSVKMRHTDQSLAFRAGWQARAAVDQNTRRAAPEASALPTNDEVYAEVRRQRGSLPGYVSTNAVNDVMAAVRSLLAAPVAAPEAPKTGDKHSKLPWRITDAPRKIVGADGATVANLTALDLPNAELIVASVNRAAPEAPASEQQAAMRDCEDCEGSGRIGPNELCARCNQSGILPAATTASASIDTPEIDALMAKWDDDGATRGAAFIELRDKARQLERCYYIAVEAAREASYRAPLPAEAVDAAPLDEATREALEAAQEALGWAGTNADRRRAIDLIGAALARGNQ